MSDSSLTSLANPPASLLIVEFPEDGLIALLYTLEIKSP